MTRTGAPSPDFRSTPTGGHVAPMDLASSRPLTRRLFDGIGFRTRNPPVETLPPDHRGRTGYVKTQAPQSHDTTLRKSNVIGLSAHMTF
ncbi:hypothetical protein AVEN_199835-1 [Araneus ventricosus]|uniref:Uncharacterized protein n=1 Tax=Araneus ventricosus TaxID=182803 RepID=A0A4Y2DUA2_ARAVE|nr:hypothetical protein AVEN_199835-1 [Araneus ventricosus]